MTALYRVHLACFQCGSAMGAVITADVQTSIRALPCPKCSGAPTRTGDVDRIAEREKVDRQQYDSRRGRPPQWLVEERRRALEALAG